jgi:hypothetical protein
MTSTLGGARSRMQRWRDSKSKSLQIFWTFRVAGWDR